MASKIDTKTFTVGEKPDETILEIRFTTYAMMILEQALGFAAPMVGLRIAKQEGVYREIAHMFWAGLEGARIFHERPRRPYTVEEACVLIDRMGGIKEAMKMVSPAFMDSFPKPETPEEIKDAQEAGFLPVKDDKEDPTETGKPEKNESEESSKKGG